MTDTVHARDVAALLTAFLCWMLLLAGDAARDALPARRRGEWTRADERAARRETRR